MFHNPCTWALSGEFRGRVPKSENRRLATIFMSFPPTLCMLPRHPRPHTGVTQPDVLLCRKTSAFGHVANLCLQLPKTKMVSILSESLFSLHGLVFFCPWSLYSLLWSLFPPPSPLHSTTSLPRQPLSYSNRCHCVLLPQHSTACNSWTDGSWFCFPALAEMC